MLYASLGHRRLEREIARIRQSGAPTTVQELYELHQRPPGENPSEAVLAAIDGLQYEEWLTTAKHVLRQDTEILVTERAASDDEDSSNGENPATQRPVGFVIYSVGFDGADNAGMENPGLPANPTLPFQ